MISKISYIKLIREDIRHRGWLAALSGVLLFLSMPVYTLKCSPKVGQKLCGKAILNSVLDRT